jgi:hypothetical protein
VLIARRGKAGATSKAAAAESRPTWLGQPAWKVAHMGCQYLGCVLLAIEVGIAWCYMYGNTAASVAGSLLYHSHKYIGMSVVVKMGGQVGAQRAAIAMAGADALLTGRACCGCRWSSAGSADACWRAALYACRRPCMPVRVCASKLPIQNIAL